MTVVPKSTTAAIGRQGDTMSTEEELAALRIRYMRLHRAAKAVVSAAQYPAAPEEQPKVFRGQLKDLEREVAGEVQPHSKLTWMSVT
jgi:hypothetical protein